MKAEGLSPKTSHWSLNSEILKELPQGTNLMGKSLTLGRRLHVGPRAKEKAEKKKKKKNQGFHAKINKSMCIAAFGAFDNQKSLKNQWFL